MTPEEPLNADLELAIAMSPDDVAHWRSYADWLEIRCMDTLEDDTDAYAI